MGAPGFAGKLSILVRQIVTFRSEIGKSDGDEPATRHLSFRFQKIFTAQILVT